MKAVKRTIDEPTYAQVRHLELITMKAADLENTCRAAGVPENELAHLRAIVIKLKGMV